MQFVSLVVVSSGKCTVVRRHGRDAGIELRGPWDELSGGLEFQTGLSPMSDARTTFRILLSIAQDVITRDEDPP